MAVIEQALDCGDKESALDTFQILVDRIKSDEAELVQEIQDYGLDAYEKSDIGARDSKAYAEMMVGIRFAVLEQVRSSLQDSVAQRLTDEGRVARKSEAAREWSALVDGAKGVMITQRLSSTY